MLRADGGASTQNKQEAQLLQKSLSTETRCSGMRARQRSARAEIFRSSQARNSIINYWGPMQRRGYKDATRQMRSSSAVDKKRRNRQTDRHANRNTSHPIPEAKQQQEM